jgi:hypothetical protein
MGGLFFPMHCRSDLTWGDRMLLFPISLSAMTRYASGMYEFSANRLMPDLMRYTASFNGQQAILR